MKKLAIWDNGNQLRENERCCVDAKEIETKIYTYDAKQIISNFTIEELTELKKKWIENNPDERFSIYELEEIEGIKIKDVSEIYITPDDQILYSNGEFCNIDDWETTEIYQHWDGSNWKDITPIDSTEFDYIEITDNCINIDEWDGHNNVTGGTGCHAKVYKTSDNEYAWFEWSQWQGAIDTIEICTIEEIKEILKEYNRDVDEYIGMIENIEIK